MSRLHVFKITRLTLTQVIQFVETLDHKETVKIVHLVRDPRAIFNSRFKQDQCMDDECGDMKATCDIMMKDVETYAEMKKQLPHNLFQIKYEHLAVDPFKYSKKLFKELNIEFSTEVMSFLKTHTKLSNGEKPSPYSTINDSKKTPLRWMSEMSINN
ncbi:carbohydrate sulfotransferase 3-like protein, partial [Leptotrombidium deliense]